MNNFLFLITLRKTYSVIINITTSYISSSCEEILVYAQYIKTLINLHAAYGRKKKYNYLIKSVLN